MNRLLLRTKARLRDVTKPVAEAAVGALTIGLLRTTRYFDPDKTANFLGRVTRFIGRRLREDRIGRENLQAAFPSNTFFSTRVKRSRKPKAWICHRGTRA